MQKSNVYFVTKDAFIGLIYYKDHKAQSSVERYKWCAFRYEYLRLTLLVLFSSANLSPRQRFIC